MEEKEAANDETLSANAAIEEAQEKIELYNKYKRLMQNQDFQEVILNGYLQEYAVSLFQELTSGRPADEERMKMYIRKIEAISTLSGYLDGLATEAELAKQRIERTREWMSKKESEE